MSSYINFYIKNENGSYTDLADCSRSTTIYHCMSEIVPYGSGRPFNEVKPRIDETLAESKDNAQRAYKEYMDKIDILKGFEHPSIDIIEQVESYYKWAQEWKQEFQDIREAEIILNFLYWQHGDTIWVGEEWDPNYEEG